MLGHSENGRVMEVGKVWCHSLHGSKTITASRRIFSKVFITSKGVIAGNLFLAFFFLKKHLHFLRPQKNGVRMMLLSTEPYVIFSHLFFCLSESSSILKSKENKSTFHKDNYLTHLHQRRASYLIALKKKKNPVANNGIINLLFGNTPWQ